MYNENTTFFNQDGSQVFCCFFFLVYMHGRTPDRNTAFSPFSFFFFPAYKLTKWHGKAASLSTVSSPEICYFPSFVGVAVPHFLPANAGCILYVHLGTANPFV